MKKVIFLLIITMLLPKLVLAKASYSSNVGGGYLPPSRGGGGICNNTSYWASATTDSYMLYGLRVSIYKYDANNYSENYQVGRTVDVWNWGIWYQSNYANGKYSSSKADNLEDWTKADENKFTGYYVKANHANNYFSRVDYARLGASAEKISGGKYYFYFDREAAERIIYKSDGNTVKNGPLFYTLQDSNKQMLVDYFTDKDVIKRYLILTEADGLINLEAGDYQIVLEPVVNIDSCVNNTYGGYYTISDIGHLLGNIPLNDSLKQLPGTLVISESLTVNNAYFTYPIGNIESNGKIKKYSVETDFKVGIDWNNYSDGNSNRKGIGMAVISGSIICEPNCKPSVAHYQVVYHTIALSNPFLTLSGNKRNLAEGSNWYGKEDTIDYNIYAKSPKYTVVLTPSSIKAIRNSNKSIEYSNINDITYQKFRNDFGFIFE